MEECLDFDDDEEKEKNQIVVCSGYFAPPTLSHLDYLRTASKFGKLIVIVNNDIQLKAKKGYITFDEKYRLGLIGDLGYVHKTILSIDRDESVLETLKSVGHFNFFMQGGDREQGKCNNREEEYAISIGATLGYGIGGPKLSSSTELIENLIKGYMEYQKNKEKRNANFNRRSPEN